MAVLFGDVLGDYVLGGVVVFSLGVTAYLTRNAFQVARARRRQQLARERQRREFWGFE